MQRGPICIVYDNKGTHPTPLREMPVVSVPMRHPSIQRGALAISRVIFSYGAYPLYISTDESKGMFSDIIQPML